MCINYVVCEFEKSLTSAMYEIYLDKYTPKSPFLYQIRLFQRPKESTREHPRKLLGSLPHPHHPTPKHHILLLPGKVPQLLTDGAEPQLPQPLIHLPQHQHNQHRLLQRQVFQSGASDVSGIVYLISLFYHMYMFYKEYFHGYIYITSELFQLGSILGWSNRKCVLIWISFYYFEFVRIVGVLELVNPFRERVS